MRARVLAWALLCAASALASTSAVRVAGAEADIALPEKPNGVERFAAEELAYHLEKALGARPRIVCENEARTAKRRIYLGATKAAATAGLPGAPFAEEEHLVRTVGDDLYLLGEDTDVPYARVTDTGASKRTGTLYAVYDYLENDCGVRWIFPGELGEVIPARTALPLPTKARRAAEPLVSRKWSGTGKGGDKTLGFVSKDVRERYFEAQRLYLCRHRVGHRRYIAAGHSFGHWWKRYGKEHPEYFNRLPNGRREPLYGNAWGVTMCVSEPGVWKQKVAEWKARLPDVRKAAGTIDEWLPWINCCENDYAGLCTCSRCRAWDAPDSRFARNDYWNGTADDAYLADLQRREGNYGLDRVCGDERWVIPKEDPATRQAASLSDRYLKFYNEVLALARRDDPSARVIGYAYDNYVEAPKETRVADGVVIEFVSRSYFPYDRVESDWFRRHWNGWRAAGAREMVHRPNFTLACGNYPVDCGRRVVDDFAFAYTNGMIACMFDNLRGSWSCHLMESYALMRAFRDPLRGYEKARADVLTAFGAAAPAVNRYLDRVERFTAGWTEERFRKAACRNITGGRTPGGSFPNTPAILGDFYDEGFFPQMQAMLDEARAAAGQDARVIARIDYLKKGLRDAELTRACRLAQKAKEARPEDAAARTAFARAFRELVDFRASVEGDFICNFQHEVEDEMRIGWPHGKLGKEYEVW